MRTSTLLTTTLAAFAASTPLVPRVEGNYFQISNFSYGCTTTCDWSFSVTIPNTSANHPAVSSPVTCSGSLDDQDYVTCGSMSSTQTISAYIKKSNNNLKLQYEVNEPKKGARYDYYGHSHVNAATSGEPQAEKFRVKESRVTAVA